jgi:BirA family biotin operon repressor/biotin-[acetyl-CoA-carboxylase] ligase
VLQVTGFSCWSQTSKYLKYHQKQNTGNRKLVYFAKNSNLLPQPPDTKPIGFPFVELQSVDSTNNYARQQVHAGLAQHGMAVFAHEQLSGKGQRGKTWSSERDLNILLSIVVKPGSLLLTQQFMLSAAMAVAAHEFFKNYAGDDTKIKWPNDLYWQDRKAGGLLIESIVGGRDSRAGTETSAAGNQQPEKSVWHWAVVGFGININQTIFLPDLPNPVSLKQITGREFPVVELSMELCGIIEKYFRLLVSGDHAQLLEKYNANLYKKNRPVKLKKDNRVFEAVIRSVSPAGKLMVWHALDEAFGFGEVEWLI